MKGSLLEGKEEEEGGFGEAFFVGVLDVDVFFHGICWRGEWRWVG